jgi:hypothetical protein
VASELTRTLGSFALTKTLPLPKSVKNGLIHDEEPITKSKNAILLILGKEKTRGIVSY